MAPDVVLLREASREILIKQNILKMGISRLCKPNHLGFTQVENLFKMLTRALAGVAVS